MRRHERGFALVEILVCLVLVTVASASVLHLHAATVGGNRRGHQLTRATRIGQTVMEELRNKTIAQIEGGLDYGDVVESRVRYRRAVTVADIADHPNLALVAVTVRYGENGDESASEMHTLVLQELRTRAESF